MKPCKVLLLVAISFATPVFANDNGTDFEAESKALYNLIHYDSNKDGRLSYKERLAGKRKDFKKADANQDGFLNWNEFKIMHEINIKDRISGMFNLADENIDGHLSMGEFLDTFMGDGNSNQIAIIFSLLDTIADNQLSMDEVTSVIGREEDEKLMWQFAKMDANGDIQLSLKEFIGKPRKSLQPVLLQ